MKPAALTVLLATFCVVVALALPAAAGPTFSVVNSAHNLSAGGPGNIRASSEQQVCIFCHTPHHASPTQPLWNRQIAPSAYRPYSSTSLNANPGQPTGASKLCLSCHDGTIALGNIVSRSQPIAMAQGMTVLPPGHSNLGTDLSDDHPISFRYDATLFAKDAKLKDPRGLPTSLKLDGNQELQCTTCHDAHDNGNGKFLVMPNNSSELCAACHNPGTTTIVGHQQCAGCHQMHTAPSGPWLLKQAKVTSTCIQCHSGGTGANQGPNVNADLNKLVNHDSGVAVNIPNHAPDDADCSDCHGSHTMTKAVASAPTIPGRYGKVRGVNAGGTAIAEAANEYEVCFRCHADNQNRTALVSRVIVQTNTRLEFATSAVSSHSVIAARAGLDVPSLKPGWSVGSIMYCSDCHASDTGHKAGGTGPDGTHGSAYPGLLIARYDTTDNTTESATAYALCYRCHDRTTLMTEGGPFKYHKKHVQEKKSPCSACHDPHGITSAQGSTLNNSHLINFDTRIVTANSASKLYYQRNGSRTGACYLRCHGENHNPENY